MSMNLIQIQDKLKSLPNDPRVMQLLTGYANGQSPHVPPYLALGELNRRKVEAEKNQMQQAGQPPGGTVKDQIEQQTGVMALKQGQQQQAMQNMMRQGMSGAPVPQGTPQPQAQGQVMAAAGGGLASLAPKGYRSGGVIAFSEGDLVEEDDREADEGAGEDDEKVLSRGASPTFLAEGPIDAETELARLMRLREMRSGMKPTPIMSLSERQKIMAERDPERYGILNTPIGQDAIKRMQDLQGAQRSEFATQREELAKSKPGILQLLGQAAMNSRGQKGGSALASILGGYSELASGADAKQLQQEQGLRMRELELQKVETEALNKIDDIKRARADGDLATEEKREMELARLAKEYNISENSALGRQISAVSSIVAGDRKSKRSAEATMEAARLKADVNREAIKAANNRAFRPGEKERILNRIEKLRKDGKTEEADQLAKDYRSILGSATSDRQIKSDRLIVEAQLRVANNVLTNSASKPDEKEKAKADIARLNKQLRNMGPKDEDDEETVEPTQMLYYDAKGNLIKG
jgi:hypothetical protein